MDAAIIDRIFKNYDVRGLVEEEITEELAYAIGNAFARHYGLSSCVVGRDGRKDSPRYTEHLIRGLLDAGCDVQDIGLTSTPQIKWVVAHHNKEAGIMVTASHNPPTYNGFKFIGANGLAIGEDAGLHELKGLLERPEKATQEGERSEHHYLEEFVRYTIDAAGEVRSDREVFVDASGGVFGQELEKLSELTGLNLTLYNCELDPTFSVHPPNPLEPEATEDAREYCGMNRCIGVVFDADGDRSIFIDEDGKEVPGDFYGAWVVERTFEHGDGGTGTVRDSRAVRDAIKEKGGRFVLGKVGHANIQRLMVDEDLRLGTEKSGHVFFRESHTAENGVYALLLVLKHLEDGERLADGVGALRERYLASPEINFRVRDRDEAITAAKEHYAARGELTTMDGVLCEGEDWWVNIRPSNTEPLVRLTFEARDQETYQSLEREARSLLEPLSAQDAE